MRESSRGNPPIDVIVAPGKLRVIATTPDGEVVNVINGDAGWIRDAKGTRPINPNQADHMKQVADAFRIILPCDSVDPWIGAARRYSVITTDVKVDSKLFEP